MAFFFSAIASQEKKKGSINENTDEESSSEDEIPSSFSQQWLEGNLNERKQITLPCDCLLGRVEDSKRCARQPNFCA